MQAAPTPVMDALIRLLNFETFWAYYLQSEGMLYPKECKQAAMDWICRVEEMMRDDLDFNNTMNEHEIMDLPMVEALRGLKEWAGSSVLLPHENPMKSRFNVFLMVTPVKEALYQRVGSSLSPEADYNFDETTCYRNYIRWGSHIDSTILPRLPEDVPPFLSSTPSIVVFGDVRKSQDLMTYSPSPAYFSKQMLTLIKETRRLIAIHGGIFDKFTGDGFLAFFNQGLCELAGKDYMSCFLGFVQELLSYSNGHFGDWVKNIRKVPPNPVGLSLGADLGSVIYLDEENHLIAVGDAIVWAERMCSCGESGEVVCNNILANKLGQCLAQKVSPKKAMTKSGEEFLAYVLDFS